MMFKSVTPCYTGGCIYVFTGSLENGNYFIADSCEFDIREINVNPDDYDFCDEVLQADWQEKHLVKDYKNGSAEAKQFFEKMLEWVMENRPNEPLTNNYTLSDMIELKKAVAGNADEEILKESLEEVDPDESAEYMAELLMDDTTTTWKMYERLVGNWLNGSTEYRNGLNDAVILITGWSLDTIAKKLTEKEEEE